MKNIKAKIFLTYLILSASFITSTSCSLKKDTQASNRNTAKNEQMFIATMQKHLNAVSNRDLETLQSTMSPTGEMQLILPQTEIINSVQGFLNYHREQMFIATMQKHLNAVSNRDLETLQSTMSPTGEMQLILPQTEIINSVQGFLNYHREWFALPNWTFETKILNTKIYEHFGMAIVEIIYREPERNGKPYFNKMIVSYDLEKINGNWYIVKDHASSVKKSTDK